MVERTIQVTEGMAEFIQWLNDQGEDAVREKIRTYLAKIKEEHDVAKESRVTDGFKWDAALEPNDGNNQWKHGGDCNLCRKVSYCLTQCRPNRLLKQVSHPMLYQMYLEENPDAAAKAMAAMNPEKLAQQLGVPQ